MAGYSKKTAFRMGQENMQKPAIRKALESLAQSVEEEGIANVIDRQKFYTKIMRDETEKTSDRIKAAETLGRAQGDFIERIEVKEMGVVVVPEKSLDDDEWLSLP